MYEQNLNTITAIIRNRRSSMRKILRFFSSNMSSSTCILKASMIRKKVPFSLEPESYVMPTICLLSKQNGWSCRGSVKTDAVYA